MKNYNRLIILSFTACMAISSCQNKDDMIFDYDASAPVISKAVVDVDAVRYGESVEYTVAAKDANALSHLRIEMTVNGETVYSKTVAADRRQEMEVSESIGIPFGSNCLDCTASLEVVAMNSNAKVTGQVVEISVARPDFQKIYLVADGVETELVNAEDPLNPYLFKGSVDIANGTEAFLFSEPGQKGYAWGFDEGTNTCSLDSKEPVKLEDSLSEDGKVHEVTFDALTFEILPLKREMSVNDVAFMKYRRNPSDEGFVNNALCAKNVALAEGEEVRLSLIDLESVKFDPDYFTEADGKLIYNGKTGTVNLYMNTLFGFVFVESDENPIQTGLSYPDILLCNGWGIGRPELWSYQPDWNFNNALILRKIAESDDETVYSQTAVVSKWANFKFYSSRDWGGEFPCPEIVFDTADFVAHEESGKPGNYNIYTALEDDTEWKSAVIKIVFRISKAGSSYKMQSEILATSNQD